jgi:hypothetical protein
MITKKERGKRERERESKIFRNEIRQWTSLDSFFFEDSTREEEEGRQGKPHVAMTSSSTWTVDSVLVSGEEQTRGMTLLFSSLLCL